MRILARYRGFKIEVIDTAPNEFDVWIESGSGKLLRLRVGNVEAVDTLEHAKLFIDREFPRK